VSPTHEVSIVIDCDEPHTLALFWAEALSYEVKGTMEQYALVAPKPGLPGLRVLLQGVEEPKAAKNRVHLDLHTNELDDEVARLQALGARKVESEPRSMGRTRWHVMADPEGKELCVVSPIS
jgi:predicted enzyme related to lactoylglutathione lyase